MTNNSHLTIDYLTKYASGNVFVETGTFEGETVDLVLESGLFREIHTIELDDNLYQNVLQAKYQDETSVFLWPGDSVTQLPVIIARFDEPMTFWLDAHASGPYKGGAFGGSPIEYELRAIQKSGRKDHAIFIDDKRLFGSAEWDYVSEKSVMDILKEINLDYNIAYLNGHVPKDVICATVREVDASDLVPQVKKDLPKTLSFSAHGIKVVE